jgi:hypothetical protein
MLTSLVPLGTFAFLVWQELCLALSVWFLRLSIVLSVRIWDLRECCLTDFCDDMK